MPLCMGDDEGCWGLHHIAPCGCRFCFNQRGGGGCTGALNRPPERICRRVVMGNALEVRRNTECVSQRKKEPCDVRRAAD